MAKSLIFIALLTSVLSCRTTIDTFQTSDKSKIGVKSNKLRGTIFTTSYQAEKLLLTGADSINSFTPTQKEITFAERILRKQIKEANKSHLNQFGKRQYIDRNLNKYFRQYVGFINNKGERIIHINLHWDRFTLTDRMKGYWDNRLDYLSDYSITLDGGSRYWSVNVNLTKEQLYGLSVNGVG